MNPTTNATMISGKSLWDTPTTLNPEQLHNIEAELLRKNDLAILVVLFLAVEGGVRLVEMAAIKLADVDLGKKTVELNSSGKNKHGRVCFFHDKAAHYIEQYLALLPAPCETPYLLLSVRGEKLSPRIIQQRFSKAARMAGVEGTGYHRLRRTFGANLVAAGASGCILTQLGGWRSMSVTKGYVRLQGEELRELYLATMRKLQSA